MKGRKPVPSSVLRLRGSAKGNRPQEPQPTQLDADPPAPAHLDEIAAGKWAELAPICREMGTLTRADLHWLAVFCVAFSRLVRAEGKLREAGEVVTHHNGVEGQSHWLRVGDLAVTQMMRASERLGLSAMDRTRLHVQPGSVARVATKDRFFKVAP